MLRVPGWGPADHLLLTGLVPVEAGPCLFQASDGSCAAHTATGVGSAHWSVGLASLGIAAWAPVSFSHPKTSASVGDVGPQLPFVRQQRQIQIQIRDMPPWQILSLGNFSKELQAQFSSFLLLPLCHWVGGYQDPSWLGEARRVVHLRADSPGEDEAGEEEEDKVGGGRNTGETDSRDVIGKKASGKKIKEERLALIFLMDWGEGDKEKGQSLQD